MYTVTLAVHAGADRRNAEQYAALLVECGLKVERNLFSPCRLSSRSSSRQWRHRYILPSATSPTNASVSHACFVYRQATGRQSTVFNIVAKQVRL